MATLIEGRTAKGKPSFQVQFMYRNRQFKRSLGTTTRFKADQVMERCERRLKEVKAGFLQPPPEDSDVSEFFIYGRTVTVLPKEETHHDSVPTFETAKDAYLEYEKVRLAETHYKTKGVHLGNFSKFLGRRSSQPVSDIQLSDVQAYVIRRRKKVKPVTVNKETKTIRHFFGQVVRHGHIQSNPVEGVELLKEGGSLVRFRTLEEVERELKRGGYSKDQEREFRSSRYLPGKEVKELLEICEENDPEFLPLLTTYAFTGMRRGEALRIEWPHVELDRRVIRAGSRKQSKRIVMVGRDIDMHDQLFELLSRHHKKSRGRLVFSDGKGQPLDPGQVSHRFKALVDGTKFQGIGLHCLRHSFASNLAAEGVDQRIIDHFMGHQTEEMRRRYQHLFPAKRDEAIHRLPY